MGTINDVRALAVSLMNKEYTFIANGKTYVVSPSKIGYRFEFDTAKRRFGCCSYNRRMITLSLPLCSENLDKIETRIQNTILHEIAHALCVSVYGITYGRGHGANWQSIAKQIGCDGKRCYDGSTVNKPKSKYTLICDNCGSESSRHRMVYSNYACSKCCNEHNRGKYTEKFKMRVIQNH